MNIQSLAPLTCCLVKATLAAGTTSTVSTTGATVYAINGLAYSKAALLNAATPTVDVVTNAAFKPISAGQGSVYVFGFDAAGTLRVCQGEVQALDASSNFINAPQFPGVPENVAAFGYLVAKAGATAVGTWTFGVNNLSAVTGLSCAFADLISLPGRPRVS